MPATLTAIGSPGPAYKILRFSFAFDTPGLIAGIVVATLHDGDAILGDQGVATRLPVTLSIFEAWNGTNPASRIVLDNGVDAPYAPWGDNDMTGADFTVIGGVSPIDLYQTRTQPVNQGWSLIARGGDITVLLQLDDSVGGDPGSTQGQGELIIPIARA